MSDSIVISGPVAFLSTSKSAVYFSKTNTTAGTYSSNARGTSPDVKKLQNLLDVAFWGEDNRFPQNIENQMRYCGVGKAGLDWKARALWGSGIIAGKVTDIIDGGKTEVFEVVKPADNPLIYKTLNDRRFHRFMLEYLQDWAWFGNCFPEAILSYDTKTITGWVHQESCDSRFKQMNDRGEIDKVFLSKLWGATSDQYAKFDDKKAIRGLVNSPNNLENLATVDNKFIKSVDCIDMYDALESLTEIAKNQRSSKGLAAAKSAILPVNYPSVNKTYYQVPAWDGARMAGWVEIASKIPSMIKMLYEKAFSIKYHVEIPETYFEEKYGVEKWATMGENNGSEQVAAKKELLKQMDEYLTGNENAYKTFVSFFNYDKHEGVEFGRIKITPIEDKTNLDKEIITQSAADNQLMVAMGLDPVLFGAGSFGSGQQRSGGSDKREAYLMYTAGLQLERNVLLEPLYLMKEFNREVGGVSEWEEGIVFRFRDTVLTTLDQNTGTVKKVS
jgi:hypothetical protein